MNHSEHYNLNLVEGSDIFNPLVNDVPNFETIDTQMFANAIASVGGATELVSGTAHTVVRLNPDAVVFRFVSTGRWMVGDTMTVDGVPMSVQTPSGAEPGDNAYVAGASVVGIVSGESVTLLVSDPANATAQDSEKLGGQLPSYYGKSSDVEANTTAITTINGKLKNLITGTLAQGSDTLIISDPSIRTDSVIDIYYQPQNGIATEPVNYASILVGTGVVTLTFEPLSYNLTVGIRVN